MSATTISEQSISKMHICNREIISHLLCCECNQWWSVSDLNYLKTLFCPYCGANSQISIIDIVTD